MSIETKSMQDSIRLDAWRAVFQKVDRILSEQDVSVQIVEAPDQVNMANVPAWSDGLDIFLSAPKIKEMLSSNDKLGAVLRLKGLNYHELCHVLYTPRMSDELVRRLRKKVEETGQDTWWYAFNALEDQRIETWFTSTYSASRRYFEATILEWIIKNGTAESAVLIYGRKYLTPRIRVQSGRVFVKRYGQELYDEFKTVIDDYLTLVLPENSIKAMKLISDYVDLLRKMQSASGAVLPMLVIEDNGGAVCPQGAEAEGVARKGRVFIKPARDAAARAGEVIEDAIDADLAEEARRATEDAFDPADGGSGKGQQQGGGDQAQDAQDGGQGSQEGDEDGSGQHSQGSDVEGSGDGASDSGHVDDHVAQGEKTLSDEMKDMVDNAYDEMDDVREDDFVQNDVDRMLDAVKAAVENGKLNAQGAAVRGSTSAPDDEANLAVRKVHDILSRIRQEAEPETLRRQVHGRVDPRRLVQRRPHETDIFKTWAHGNEDEVGVESVVLVDVSGSMANVLDNASKAMWALKRAFDKLDIRTTVLIFDTNHTVMYQPSEKAKGGGVPVLRPGGGTDPTSALNQASRILFKSQAPNKVLITVTDGQWGGSEENRKAMMRSMHRQGVVSLLLGLSGARGAYGKHDHLEGYDIGHIGELPKVATKLVASIMRKSITV